MTALAAATNATHTHQEDGKLGPGARVMRCRRCLPSLSGPMGSLMGFFVCVDGPAAQEHPYHS